LFFALLNKHLAGSFNLARVTEMSIDRWDQELRKAVEPNLNGHKVWKAIADAMTTQYNSEIYQLSEQCDADYFDGCLPYIPGVMKFAPNEWQALDTALNLYVAAKGLGKYPHSSTWRWGDPPLWRWSRP
jgi:hypothetical protein